MNKELEELEQISDQTSFHPKGETNRKTVKTKPKMSSEEIRARLKQAQNTYLTKKRRSS